MKTSINLYSLGENEIVNFLNKYYNKKVNIENKRQWIMEYDNPIEMSDIIGIFVDNNYKFKITMWVSLDPGIYINVNDNNGDKIIRYLYERYPN